MDWYLEASNPKVVQDLRHQFTRYIRRHAREDSDVEGASLIFSELVTNAVRHAGGPAWVALDWSAASPVLTVHDLGSGFSLRQVEEPDVESERGRGLLIVSHLTDRLEVASKRAGGTKVRATLPIERDTERSHDPPRSKSGTLPSSEEARPDGTFGRESFLRALVVQLARSVETEHGPDAAEAAVAQVGADVGGRIEEEYRAVRDITGRLSIEEMSELYVLLKRAIEGDFYIIEATEERIVLGNRCCPFGDVVKKAPALCRMTSSVFGGIAARNRGSAAVQLEERIAVGDPECRVIVWLTEPPPEAAPFAHHYRAPSVSND